MDDFMIYPAIDLREGRVVRLAQGDPDRETAYGNQPLAVARRWQSAGATWLHVVNLDGAFGEAGQANLDALTSILTAELHVQFGGGMRDMDGIRRALDLGVTRVVLGTVAAENPAMVKAALDAFASEPPIGSPLLQLANVVLTPHIGAHTQEAIERVGVLAARNVVQALQAGEPIHRVV